MIAVGRPPSHLQLNSNLLSFSPPKQIVSTPVNAHCGEAHCHCKEGYVLLLVTYHPVPFLTLFRTIGATARPSPTASAEAVFVPGAEAELF